IGRDGSQPETSTNSGVGDDDACALSPSSYVTHRCVEVKNLKFALPPGSRSLGSMRTSR
ncbi:unnamed protein product, partial [Ixodes hexagonus]